MMSLVERLRRDRGLSQARLAATAKVAPLVVWKVENWKPVRQTSYDKIAAALEVPVRDLLKDYASNTPNAS